MTNGVDRASWVEVEGWDCNVGWAESACSVSGGFTYKGETFVTLRTYIYFLDSERLDRQGEFPSFKTTCTTVRGCISALWLEVGQLEILQPELCRLAAQFCNVNWKLPDSAWEFIRLPPSELRRLKLVVSGEISHYCMPLIPVILQRCLLLRFIAALMHGVR